jgi:hypothetical protein
MSDSELYRLAAQLYAQAGLEAEAGRCYRLAGAYRQAAERYQAAGDYYEAAADYERARVPEIGAWLLVHMVGDPAAARELISPHVSSDDLRHQLVLAHCAISEGADPASVLPVIEAVCNAQADVRIAWDRIAEEWAVALSERLVRYDQAALVFAAGVRGRRHGAAERWKDWARQRMDSDLMIPAVTEEGRIGYAAAT